MSNTSCPFCSQPKKPRNKTCGSPACVAQQQQATRAKSGYGAGALHDPFGIPKGSRRIIRKHGPKGPKGGVPVELCGDCKQVVDGRCRIFIGDLNERFSYGRECSFKE